LHQSEGFNRYGELCQWLETQLGITAPYKTVHQLVHYHLKVAPKVARPVSAETVSVKVEAYKKLPENLAMLAWYAVAVLGLSGQVCGFCQDETRLGLKTISGRKITTKGINPKGKVQWQFKTTYLYGVVEPSTGESFFYEFTHLNSDCFPVFLNLVSERYKDSIVIMPVDQAGAHHAKRLQLPTNISLLFQPLHAPETNPIERVWQYFK